MPSTIAAAHRSGHCNARHTAPNHLAPPMFSITPTPEACYLRVQTSQAVTVLLPGLVHRYIVIYVEPSLADLFDRAIGALHRPRIRVGLREVCHCRNKVLSRASNSGRPIVILLGAKDLLHSQVVVPAIRPVRPECWSLGARAKVVAGPQATYSPATRACLPTAVHLYRCPVPVGSRIYSENRRPNRSQENTTYQTGQVHAVPSA
jgi:hypothetical protein